MDYIDLFNIFSLSRDHFAKIQEEPFKDADLWYFNSNSMLQKREREKKIYRAQKQSECKKEKGNVIFIAFVVSLNAYKNAMFFSATVEMVTGLLQSLSNVNNTQKFQNPPKKLFSLSKFSNTTLSECVKEAAPAESANREGFRYNDSFINSKANTNLFTLS